MNGFRDIEERDVEAVTGFYETLGYEVNPVLCMARKIGD